ncbi:MAG: NTP transferase domain-containing protein [Betaproteobacteria bacterium]|nr:NTP transferase domain-containing protein [Betaproteobacteria bacterium]MBI2960507.1 NTP transferase domain-containing protein [Betaproteobacteria bacterium]
MKILAMVLAGGEGSRLYPLTAMHAKPALPFVNGYRIIDFVLSNLANSGISSVYVLAQYKPCSLIDHLGAVWAPRFNRIGGFLTVICPKTAEGEMPFKGTADAVHRNLHLVERHGPEVVAVFAADHVYRMDVCQMAEFHLQRNADVSVAAVPVPIEKASAFGVMVTEGDTSVRKFQEKPARPFPMPSDPTRAYASMGNYLFMPRVLEPLLEEAKRAGGSDFGRHILPHLPGRYRTFAYDFSNNALPGIAPHEERGYWRDVGTLEALVAAQKDTEGPEPRFDLHNRAWPIMGSEDQAAPARGSGLRRRTSEEAQDRHPVPVFGTERPLGREWRAEA